MYSILNIELKNFIGLRKISDKTGLFNVTFENDLDKTYFLIFGENGQGKTTLLENLTPFSRMFSRPMNVSIEFPAHKKIEFINTATNETIRIETYWKEEGSTKGYIYLNNSTESTTETSKGNITEFNYQIEKIFGSYDKFKNSLFLQQGILEIVKSSPTERIKIINNFISDLSIYNSIKQQSVQEIEIIKSKIKDYEKKQTEYKTFENKYIQLSNFEEKQTEFNLKIRQEELITLEKEIEALKRDELEYYKIIKEMEHYEKKIIELEIKEPTKNLNIISTKIKELEKENNAYLEDTEYITLISGLQLGLEYNNKIIEMVKNQNIEINIDYIIDNIEEIEKQLLAVEQVRNDLMIKSELEKKLQELEKLKEKLKEEEDKSLSDKIKITETLSENTTEDSPEELIIKRDIIKNEISSYEKHKKILEDKNTEISQLTIKDTEDTIVKLNKDIQELEKKLLDTNEMLADNNNEENKSLLNEELNLEKEITKLLNIDKPIVDILNIVNKYDIYYNNLISEITKVEELEAINKELYLVIKQIELAPQNIIELIEDLANLDILKIEAELNRFLIDIEKNVFLKSEIKKKEEDILNIKDLGELENTFEFMKKNKEKYSRDLEVKIHLTEYLEKDIVTCECCDSKLSKLDIQKKLLSYETISEETFMEVTAKYKTAEQDYYNNKVELKRKQQLEKEVIDLKIELSKIIINEKEYQKLKTDKLKINTYSLECENYSKLKIVETELKEKILNINTLGKTLEELYSIKSDYINIYSKMEIIILEKFELNKMPLIIHEDIQIRIKDINNKILKYEKLNNDKNDIKDVLMQKSKEIILLNESITIYKALEKEIQLISADIKDIDIELLIQKLSIVDKNIDKNNIYKLLVANLKILENDLLNINNNQSNNIKEIQALLSKLDNMKEKEDISVVENKIKELKSVINMKNNMGSAIIDLRGLIINKDTLAIFIDLTNKKKDEIENINALLKNKANNNKNILKMKDEENNLNVLSKEITFYLTELKQKTEIFEKLKYVSVVDIKDKIYNFNEIKKEIELFVVEQTQYQENKEWIESTLEVYKKDKADFEENEKDLYMYTKIKNYSDRIRKAFVGSFFANITETINDIISNDFGTLGNLKVEINQTRADKFDILVREDNEDFVNNVNDISLLSGAEQATVARAIYFALAQFTNFGILWLDEYDGMLSETNKDGFVKMLDKIKDNLSIKQIFIISHDKNMISNVDRVVYL